MKIKYKLSIIVIAIVAVVVVIISFMLLNQASGISRDLSLRSQFYLANHQAEFWKGRQDGYIRALQTLANIMPCCEGQTSTFRRRDIFDEILKDTLRAEPIMLAIFSLWKPNALNDMDTNFIVQPGSAPPPEQYAMLFSRESGEIEGRALIEQEFEDAMAHITGPNSKKDMVEDPFPIRIGERDTFAFIIRVPIISPKTGETIGIVGCVLPVDAIQPMVQEVVERHEELAAMLIFANNSMILGHLVPERVGRMLLETESFLGDGLHEANRAVLEGKSYQQRTYSPVIGKMVEVTMLPFRIGNSDTSWSVMLVSEESYILREVSKMTIYTIIVAVTAFFITAFIVIIIISHATKPIVDITNELKYLSEGDLPRRISFNSKDEIGLLANYFNKTVENIRQTVTNIKSEAKNLSQIGVDLSNDTYETAAVMNKIAANIQAVIQTLIKNGDNVNEAGGEYAQLVQCLSKRELEVVQALLAGNESYKDLAATLNISTNTVKTHLKNIYQVVGVSKISDLSSFIRKMS